MNRRVEGGTTFCGKCRRHEPGGTGSGIRYRCPRCSAFRLAALLTGEAKQQPRRPA